VSGAAGAQPGGELSGRPERPHRQRVPGPHGSGKMGPARPGLGTGSAMARVDPVVCSLTSVCSSLYGDVLMSVLTAP